MKKLLITLIIAVSSLFVQGQSSDSAYHSDQIIYIDSLGNESRDTVFYPSHITFHLNKDGEPEKMVVLQKDRQFTMDIKTELEEIRKDRYLVRNYLAKAVDKSYIVSLRFEEEKITAVSIFFETKQMLIFLITNNKVNLYE